MHILPRAVLVITFLVALPTLVSESETERLPSTSNLPPRKVIVGTSMEAFWVDYPGLPRRLEQLGTIIDKMAAESLKKYGRRLDLAVLPEVAVNGEAGEDAFAHAFPLEGAVKESFSRKAREHQCYIVVPMYLLEEQPRRQVSNVGVLFDRKGDVAGIYRKLHPAVSAATGSMEGGITPGKEAPVFDCDFGRLGMQICFDIYFDYGWSELARKGADLVVWPSQTPQTAQPAFRALKHRYYIVSSTWRNNASIFEPTGRIISQLKPPGPILVQELDLSYAILPWSSKLQKGEALRKKYGDTVGFRYYEDEDCGLFWSNDPKITIRQMIQSIGLVEMEDEMKQVRSLFHKAGVPSH
ncbi:MAG TPA: carbon-nitrogen hydrolase family protein [Nitrospira sp.]|nr:carbon-nitrogen hydrolase family protein [Nitrospira sp.]